MINVKLTSRLVYYTSIFLIVVAALPGCSSGRAITIGSEPPGARVLADGKSIGETPVTIHQDDVFPPRWIGSSYIVKGTLALEKSGCENVSMPVNDTVLSEDIQISMNCETVTEPGHIQIPVVSGKRSVTQSATDKTDNAYPPETGINNSVEHRLGELKRLHDKGLISNPEYQEQRKRVLDSI